MLQLCGVFVLACITLSTNAAVFSLPGPDNDLVGKITHLKTQAADTLSQLAIDHDLGYTQIKQANPTVDPWLPGDGTKLTLPTQHILPSAPRKGIVINLAEMRVYYYPMAESQIADKVYTFPVGIGRKSWSTPLGKTHIVRKKAHPEWHPPISIRKEHAEKGTPLPRVVPPGPDNPLGEYALYLGWPSYLIHGTNKPAGIGIRVSHGCIQLYPEDIKKMFKMVPVGTQVTVVNQPFKAGWQKGVLYLETHLPDAMNHQKKQPYADAKEIINNAIKNRPDYPVDWSRVTRISQEATGIPQSIGPKASSTNGYLEQL